MDSHSFNSLMNGYFNPTEDDYAKVNKLITLYPYSQILHILLARVSKELNSFDRNESLQMGAVYSADRAVFKDIMTSFPDKNTASNNLDSTANIAENEVEIKDTSYEGGLHLHILKELEKLKLNKHNFTVTVEQFENSKKALRKSAKSSPSKPKTIKKPRRLSAAKKKESVTKKKIKPQRRTTKNNQDDIIDKFIDSRPKVPKISTSELVDLSEDVEDLDTDVTSETLVEILIKQGKNERAIDMLRKLILKFPQKNLYFAHQIKELEKDL